jgi:hypothetical protein
VQRKAEEQERKERSHTPERHPHSGIAGLLTAHFQSSIVWWQSGEKMQAISIKKLQISKEKQRVTFESKQRRDEINWHQLEVLQQNARLSYSESGQRVELTALAVAERTRKMVEQGIITGCIVRARSMRAAI